LIFAYFMKLNLFRDLLLGLPLPILFLLHEGLDLIVGWF
jgi:hypothetical protein